MPHVGLRILGLSESVLRDLLAIFVCCVVLIADAAGAQSVSVKHWASRDALSTSGVLSVGETQEGDLWVGTEEGLRGFDGSHFRQLRPFNIAALTSSRIDFMATGLDGVTYVGSDDHLYVFHRNHAQTFPLRRGNKILGVRIILPVGRDEAWIGTFAGYLFHYKNGSMERIGARVLPKEAIYGLAKTPDDTLWLATGIGLFSVKTGIITRYQPKKPLPTKSLYDLAVSPDGTLYAASDLGLFAIRGNQWTQWTKSDGLPSNSLAVLLMDDRNKLWIGTANGLASLDGKTIHCVKSIHNSVSSLFIDTQNSLWIGCYDSAGLYRLRSTPLERIRPAPAFDLAGAKLAEGRNGTVWIGSPMGLYRYKKGKLRKFTTQDGLPSNSILNLSVASRGTVWVSTVDGLAKLANGRISAIHTRDKGILEQIYHVIQSSDGSLWVASNRGLAYRSSGALNFSFLRGFTNVIQTTFQDQSGAIWVGTYFDGLYRFGGVKESQYQKSDGLGSNTVYGIAQDDSGVVWAWTAGGLSRLRDGKCENLGSEVGLPVGSPGSLAYDGSNSLWLRTPAGLAAIRVDEANAAFTDRRPLAKTRFFGGEEGLASTIDNPESLALMVNRASHQVWIPTADGIAVMSIASIPSPIAQPHPVVTSAMSDTGEHDLTAPVRLLPNDLHLQLAYKVFALLESSGRTYRYRLSGFDKEWQPGQENRDASYTSLPPGRYFFEVSSRRPFEEWSATSSPIEVIVLPHFYQTWWWYVLTGVTAVAVMWLLYRLRFVAVQKQNAAVLHERDIERLRIARELHDTLSGGLMTLHLQIQLARASILTAPDAASEHLDDAINIVRQSASETRMAISALRSEDQVGLRERLECAAATFRKSSCIPIEVHIDSDLPLLPVETQYEILRVAEEALSNVRCHSSAQHARLRAGMHGKQLRLHVEDDGSGFDFTAKSAERLGHFGLQGMRERAQRIGGTLMTHGGPGRGTKILLEVPVDGLLRRWSGLGEHAS